MSSDILVFNERKKYRRHLYWPERDYKLLQKSAFRGLPINIVRVDEVAWNLYLSTQAPPVMPPAMYAQQLIDDYRSWQRIYGVEGYRRKRNRHHLYWPRRYYDTPLEKEFRGLPIHILKIDCIAHAFYHYFQEPPEKPSREIMERVVEEYNAWKQEYSRLCFERWQYLQTGRN